MTIERDPPALHRNPPQTRLEWMIEEFEAARRRRRVRPERPVDLTPDTEPKPAVTAASS